MTSATPIRWSCGSHSMIVVSLMWRPLASTASRDTRQRRASSVLTAGDAKTGTGMNATTFVEANVSLS
jgi:hypothetical protein